MAPRLLARKFNIAWKPQNNRNTYIQPDMVRVECFRVRQKMERKAGDWETVVLDCERVRWDEEEKIKVKSMYPIYDYSCKDTCSNCFSVLGVFGRADHGMVVTLGKTWSACGLL